MFWWYKMKFPTYPKEKRKSNQPMAADGHFATQNALPTTPEGASPGRSAPLVGFSLRKKNHQHWRRRGEGCPSRGAT